MSETEGNIEEDVVVEDDKEDSEKKPESESSGERKLGSFAMLYGNKGPDEGGGAKRSFRPMLQRRRMRSTESSETEPAETEESTTSQDTKEEPTEQQGEEMPEYGESSSSSSEYGSSSDEGEDGDEEDSDGEDPTVVKHDPKSEDDVKVESSTEGESKPRPLGAFAMLYGKDGNAGGNTGASGGGGRKPFRAMISNRFRRSAPKEETKDENNNSTESEEKSEGDEANKGRKPFRPLIQSRRRNISRPIESKKEIEEPKEEEEEEEEEEERIPVEISDDDEDSVSSYGETSDEEEEIREQKKLQKSIILSNPISVLIQPSPVLVEHIEEMDDLKKTKSELTSKVREMKKMLTQLQTDCESLMDSRNYSFEIQSKLTQSDGTIRSLGIKHRNTKLELEKMRKVANEQHTENKKLKEEIEQLKNELSTKKTTEVMEQPSPKKKKKKTKKKKEVVPKLKLEEIRTKPVVIITNDEKNQKELDRLKRVIQRQKLRCRNITKKLEMSQQTEETKQQQNEELTRQIEELHKGMKRKVVNRWKDLQPISTGKVSPFSKKKKLKEQQKQNKATKRRTRRTKQEPNIGESSSSSTDLPPFKTTSQYTEFKKITSEIENVNTSQLREIGSYIRPKQFISEIGFALLLVFGYPHHEAERWVICRRFIHLKLKNEISRYQPHDRRMFIPYKKLIKIRKILQSSDREKCVRYNKVMGKIYDFVVVIEKCATELRRRDRVTGVLKTPRGRKRVNLM